MTNQIVEVPLDKYYYDITMKEFTSDQLLKMGYRVVLEDKYGKKTKESK